MKAHKPAVYHNVLILVIAIPGLNSQSRDPGFSQSRNPGLKNLQYWDPILRLGLQIGHYSGILN